MKCEKCGEPLPEDAAFCRNCGYKLPQKESFFKRNQKPIIFIAVILLVTFVAIGTYSYISDLSYQKVNVGTVSLKIPSDFRENFTEYLSENDDGIITISKTWHNSNDIIMVSTMYSSDINIDANEVNNQLGGQRTNMLGYDGFFFNDYDIYTFSFVKHNTLITIYVTDMSLFDRIEVL